jgi:hypothetical protein
MPTSRLLVEGLSIEPWFSVPWVPAAWLAAAAAPEPELVMNFFLSS